MCRYCTFLFARKKNFYNYNQFYVHYISPSLSLYLFKVFYKLSLFSLFLSISHRETFNCLLKISFTAKQNEHYFWQIMFDRLVIDFVWAKTLTALPYILCQIFHFAGTVIQVLHLIIWNKKKFDFNEILKKKQFSSTINHHPPPHIKIIKSAKHTHRWL